MTENYSFPADVFILFGRIVKAHGLKGEVKIHLYSGQACNIKNYRRVVLVDTAGRRSPALQIRKSRTAGKYAITQLSGIDNRSQAEEICTMGVLIYKEDLPQLGKNEFYYHELVGLTVQTTDGTLLGKVVNIFSNGAQEIMEIQGRGHNALIPFVDKIVIYFDKEKIIIEPPPGLLDLQS